MGRPTFLTYFAGVVIAALAGYGAARVAGLVGGLVDGIAVPIFITALLPMTAVLTFGAWDLPKHHPVGLPLGLVNFGLLMAIIFSWVCWSEQEWFIPRGYLTQGAAVTAFVFSTPGLLRWVYYHRVKKGVNAEVIATALVDEDVNLRRLAAERLGGMTLPSAAGAVPLLLWATRDRDSLVVIKAENALDKLLG